MSKNSNDLRKSVFDIEKRTKQTIETINSIRRFCPNSEIVLVEAGETNLSNKFLGFVDSYIYLNNLSIRRLTRYKNKGFGEIIILLYFLKEYRHINSYDVRFFKISGRYRLNSSFNLDKFSLGKFTFQRKFYKDPESTKHSLRIGIENFNTVLYSFTSNLIKIYSLILIVTLILALTNKSIETILHYTVPNRLLRVIEDEIGVEGFISQTGELYRA
jgi:hypothetical protein